MRISSITVTNIAGLADATVDLPDTRLAGLAGPNGVGKSTLLASMLAPWSKDLPPSGNTRLEASVSVSLQLTDAERDEVEALGRDFNDGDGRPPEAALVRVRRLPRSGIQDEGNWALRRGLTTNEFLAAVPSLNVMYIPAERRFSEQSGIQIDLDSLSEIRILDRIRASRASAIREAGRLDEQQFEQWATAASVAAYLPGGNDGAWARLKSAIDILIAPKELLPVTAAEPRVRIRTAGGRTHPIGRLSSGELQALIIVGNLLRAGADGRVAIIDEPDLHLHPILAEQMFRALVSLELNQLIIASHSPFLLDSLGADSILECRAGQPPARLSGEAERIAVYQSFGFKASELTQADVLIVPEGPGDETRLRSIDQRLARAAVRPAGGREMVLRTVSVLRRYDLPVLGVIDADIDAAPVDAELRSHIVTWDGADLESQLFRSDAVLATWKDNGWLRDPTLTVEALRAAVQGIAQARRSNAVAELAQRALRRTLGIDFPSPRVENPVERLREEWVAAHSHRDPIQLFEVAVAAAEARFDAEPDKLTLVRGKWIKDEVARLTTFASGSFLIQATVNEPAARLALQGFIEALDAVLPERNEAVAAAARTTNPVRDTTMPALNIRVQSRRVRRSLGMSVHMQPNELEQGILGAIDTLTRTFEHEGLAPAGPPFSMIEGEEHGALMVHVAFPVTTDAIRPTVLDERFGEQWQVVYAEVSGSFDDLDARHDELGRWIAAREAQATEPPWDEYLEYPSEPGGNWRVRVVQPTSQWAGIGEG